MFGALIVVFYLSLRMPSFDEHYRYIIGFECRVAPQIVTMLPDELNGERYV